MNKNIVLAFACLSVSLVAPLAAFSAPYGEFLIHQSQAPQSFQALAQKVSYRSSGDVKRALNYYGGPVISHVKVFVVFWGIGVDSQIQLNIGPFYQNILDSGYMDGLAQYATNVSAIDGRAGTGQTIGRGRLLGETTITPKNQNTNLSDEMIQKELEFQISSGALPPADADTLYMIYLPAGFQVSLPDSSHSCWGEKALLGYHEGFKSQAGNSIFYGVIPDCTASFREVSAVSSHEMVEAVTDPFPTLGNSPSYPQAWNSASGFEAADLCDSIAPLSHVSGSNAESTVEPWWDNLTGACAKGPWSQARARANLPLSIGRGHSWDSLRQAGRFTPSRWDGL